ncbi:MAG: addiction module protein [Planctomycetes bacterium]|nr:addiction module protein [Planctomycetota bacterium]
MSPDLNLSALSAAERLRLIEQLWESLCQDPSQVPVTDAQRTELERRLDEIDAGDVEGIAWEEVLRQIRGRQP